MKQLNVITLVGVVCDSTCVIVQRKKCHCKIQYYHLFSDYTARSGVYFQNAKVECVGLEVRFSEILPYDGRDGNEKLLRYYKSVRIESKYYSLTYLLLSRTTVFFTIFYTTASECEKHNIRITCAGD